MIFSLQYTCITFTTPCVLTHFKCLFLKKEHNFCVFFALLFVAFFDGEEGARRRLAAVSIDIASRGNWKHVVITYDSYSCY